MPRSIIDIEVNDQSFKAFSALFEKYQTELAKTKGLWDASAKSIENAADAAGDASFADFYTGVENTAVKTENISESFAAGAISAIAISEAMKDVDVSSKKVDVSSKKAESNFSKIADSAKSISGSILSSTYSLAKWATFGVGAGLAGIGGSVFGLDSLANSVGGQRFAAQGLGVTTGQDNAFNTTLGKTLVGSNFLGNVQGVTSDLNQQWQLAALGINPQGQDTAQIGVDVIRKAHALWNQVGKGGQNTTTMNALGLGGFMDFSTWQRIGNDSNSEINSDISKYQAGALTQGAADPINKDWQDFSVALASAGKNIEAVLERGLDPLVKSDALPKLTKAITDALTGILGSPNMKTWIDDIAQGIEWLGKEISDPKFIAGMDKFFNSVMGVAVGAVNEVSTVRAGLPPALGGTFNPSTPGFGRLGNASDPKNPSAMYGGINPFQSGISKGYDFRGIAKKNGLTAQELMTQAMIESGINAHPSDSVVNGVHYQGMLQLGPGVQTDYGVTDPYDATQNLNAGAMDMRDLLKKYNGNIAEAVASFSGDTHLDSDIKKYGPSGWLSHAPKQTQNYLEKYAKGINVTVKVLNQTGAQVAILANATQQ